jgi:glycosyltransferase involved in cell wall biosynthesis
MPEIATTEVAEAPAAANSARHLRVLFLMTRDGRNPSAAGGDVGMWERAVYLAERGHKVTVVAAGFAGGPKHEFINGIEVIRLGGILSLWWRTFIYYMTRCRGKCDVAVVEGFGGSRIPRMTPLYVKEPIITEWHQIHSDLFAAQYPKPLLPALNFLERVTAFVHRNTIVMARTQEWKEAFPRLGFKPNKIFVVPACIAEDWLAAGRSGQVAEPRIIWLGKFRRYKCPDHVIQAMQEVVRSIPNARLILAGRHDDLKYEAALRRLIDKLGLNNNVDFAFDLSEEAKRPLLSSCRVMALPSSVEGFGIVVLEANACGVPVVASSGVPVGAVRDGVNGLRYPFGDIRALGERLIQLCRDDHLYAGLSSSGLAFASHFGWRAICSQYEEVLHGAVEDRAHERVQSSLA